MDYGPRITASCIERDELEKVVSDLADLRLIEVDIVDGKYVLIHDLHRIASYVRNMEEIEASKAIEDKDWELI